VPDSRSSPAQLPAECRSVAHVRRPPGVALLHSDVLAVSGRMGLAWLKRANHRPMQRFPGQEVDVGNCETRLACRTCARCRPYVRRRGLVPCLRHQRRIAQVSTAIGHPAQIFHRPPPRDICGCVVAALRWRLIAHRRPRSSDVFPREVADAGTDLTDNLAWQHVCPVPPEPITPQRHHPSYPVDPLRRIMNSVARQQNLNGNDDRPQ